MLQIKLSQNVSAVTSDTIIFTNGEHKKLPPSLAAIIALTNVWKTAEELTTAGLNVSQLVTLIRARIADFGAGKTVFPIGPRAYLEEQFPKYDAIHSLSKLLLTPPDKVIWIGIPFSNLNNIRRSGSIGLAEIVDHLTIESDPRLLGVLPYIDPTSHCLTDLSAAIQVAQGCGVRLGVLGGDHRVAWAVLSQLKKNNSTGKLRYIHIDAHHDLYGIKPNHQEAPISHANFLVDLLVRHIIDDAILIGCRDNSRSILIAQDMGLPIRVVSSFSELQTEFENSQEPDHTHLSIDMDILDPNIAPDVSCPIPGGWSVNQLNAEIDLIYQYLTISSISLVEACQGDGDTSLIAADILRRLSSR